MFGFRRGKPVTPLFRFTGLHVAVLGAVLLLVAPGCAAWSPIWLDGTPLPEEVRVQDRSGRKLEIVRRRLEEDSILVGTNRDSKEETRIPVSQVAQLEGRSVSFGRTLLLVSVGGYLLVMAITVAMLPAT
jgi:hypothetical protein